MRNATVEINTNLSNRYKNKEIINAFKGKHLSNETKEKISISRIRYLENNPNKNLEVKHHEKNHQPGNP